MSDRRQLLDKLANTGDLRKAGMDAASVATVNAIVDELTKVCDALDRIEHADAIAKSTRQFVRDVPGMNGAHGRLEDLLAELRK